MKLPELPPFCNSLVRSQDFSNNIVFPLSTISAKLPLDLLALEAYGTMTNVIVWQEQSYAGNLKVGVQIFGRDSTQQMDFHIATNMPTQESEKLISHSAAKLLTIRLIPRVRLIFPYQWETSRKSGTSAVQEPDQDL